MSFDVIRCRNLCAIDVWCQWKGHAWRGSNCIPEWQEGHGHWERWPLEDLFNTSADAVWLAEEGNEPDDDKDLFDYRDDPRLVRIELVKDGILPGQVREFTGPDGEKSLGLIFRLFEPGVDQKDSIYMVCPIKPTLAYFFTSSSVKLTPVAISYLRISR